MDATQKLQRAKIDTKSFQEVKDVGAFLEMAEKSWKTAPGTSLPITQNVIFQEVYTSEVINYLCAIGTFAVWENMVSLLSCMIKNVQKENTLIYHDSV